MRLIGISRNRITGEIAKPVEPVNGQDKRRLQRRRWQARPSLLIGNQGGKALKWLSRPFPFWEDEQPHNSFDSGQHSMGLSALSTHSAGRRAAVKAGYKPVHFSLDGCCALRPAIFSGVWTQVRDILSRSPAWDGGFHIRPVCWWNQSCACGFPPRKHSLFSCRFKCPCPPRRQRHFYGNADSAYNTLHFATQSCVPKGALPPLDSPTTKRRYAPCWEHNAVCCQQPVSRSACSLL